jgi:UDP-GlcNAc:undecaprenyl-phosphate GlcNAc-1-phosphate transferase
MDYTMLKDSLLYIIIPLLFVALFTPVIKKVAVHINALDIPDKRKIHKKPIPRLGGLAIVSGFLLGYMLFGEPSVLMNSILIGSFIIVVTGMIDDIKPISAKVKFLLQFIAVLVVVLYGNINISKLTVFGYLIDFKWLTIPFTILFLLTCINCMNLIDGMDGLSSGISAIYFLTIGVISFAMGRFGIYYIISLILLGCTIGFLIHNFNPADIFLGDSGSMFLGYMVGVVALLGYKSVVLTSIVIPFLILVIPLLDVIFAIIRRKLKGESIATPDASHIHHQILRRTSSQKKTVLIIYLVQILFSAAAVIYLLYSPKLGYIMYGILMVVVIIFVLTTDVIFDFPSKEKEIVEKIKKKAH